MIALAFTWLGDGQTSRSRLKDSLRQSFPDAGHLEVSCRQGLRGGSGSVTLCLSDVPDDVALRMLVGLLRLGVAGLIDFWDATPVEAERT